MNNKRLSVKRRVHPVIIKTPVDDRKREANEQIVNELSQKIKRQFDESNSDHQLLQFDINWNRHQGLNLKLKFKNVSQESKQQVASKVSGGDATMRAFTAAKADRLIVPGRDAAAVSRVQRALFGSDEEEDDSISEGGLTSSTSGSSIGEHHQQQQLPSLDELVELLNMEKISNLTYETALENTEEFQQLAFHVNELLKQYIEFFEQHPHAVSKLQKIQ